MLLLPGARCVPLPPFMFGQLCLAPWLALCVGAGAAVAVLAEPGLAAVVSDADVDVVDADVPGCDVAALAMARLPPNPAPIAAVPTAVAMRILPSLVFNVPASSQLGDGPGFRTPTLTTARLR